MRQASRNVLCVGNGPDGSTIAEILGRFASVTRVEKLPAVFPASERDGYDAIFCQWEFPGGMWRDVLEKAERLGPHIPVIVLSHCGNEKQWIEVLQAGAFDLLVPPYTNYQLLAVLEHAVVSRRKTAECVTAA